MSYYSCNTCSLQSTNQSTIPGDSTLSTPPRRFTSRGSDLILFDSPPLQSASELGTAAQYERRFEPPSTPPRTPALTSQTISNLLSPSPVTTKGLSSVEANSSPSIGPLLLGSPTPTSFARWSDAAPGSSPYASSNIVAEYLQGEPIDGELVSPCGWIGSPDILSLHVWLFP